MFQVTKLAMPPTGKSKSVSKRFSYNNEAASKHGEHANTSGQKVSPDFVFWMFIFSNFFLS